MSDDSPVRKARKTASRHKELMRLLQEEGETDAGEAHWNELMTRADAGDEGAAREAVRVSGERIARLRQLVAEVAAVSEELAAVGAEAEVEASKLRSEALKHQATIAAGAIVGIATVSRTILPLPPELPGWATLLLWGVYVILLTTVCLSLLLMHVESWRVEHVLRTGEEGRTDGWAENAYLTSFAGLPISVFLFGLIQFCLSVR